MDNLKVKPMFEQKAHNDDFYVGTIGSEIFEFSDDIHVVVDWSTRKITVIDENKKTIKSNTVD